MIRTLDSFFYTQVHVYNQIILVKYDLGLKFVYYYASFSLLYISIFQDEYRFFMPPPFIMGGGAYSITLVRMSVRTYVHTYVPYVLSLTYEKWFPGDIF